MAWHPTLSSIERKTDLPQDRPRPVTGAQRREAALKVIGTWYCWCGQQRFHDWPGKDDGAVHPRPARDWEMAEHEAGSPRSGTTPVPR